MPRCYPSRFPWTGPQLHFAEDVFCQSASNKPGSVAAAQQRKLQDTRYKLQTIFSFQYVELLDFLKLGFAWLLFLGNWNFQCHALVMAIYLTREVPQYHRAIKYWRVRSTCTRRGLPQMHVAIQTRRLLPYDFTLTRCRAAEQKDIKTKELKNNNVFRFLVNRFFGSDAPHRAVSFLLLCSRSFHPAHFHERLCSRCPDFPLPLFSSGSSHLTYFGNLIIL